MKECTANTAFTITKRELVIEGINPSVEASFFALKNKIGKDLVNMLMADLRDVDNNLQFTLTIKKLENSEI